MEMFIFGATLKTSSNPNQQKVLNLQNTKADCTRLKELHDFNFANLSNIFRIPSLSLRTNTGCHHHLLSHHGDRTLPKWLEINHQPHVWRPKGRKLLGKFWKEFSPWNFNSSPMKRKANCPKRKGSSRCFQASFFRGELLNFGGVS